MGTRTELCDKIDRFRIAPDGFAIEILIVNPEHRVVGSNRVSFDGTNRSSGTGNVVARGECRIDGNSRLRRPATKRNLVLPSG